MKNIVTIFLALISANAYATVITLNKNKPSPGQYTSFPQALNAANANDTIYVSGAYSSYGSHTIDKSIVIIGTGHHPLSQSGLVSSFDTLTLSPTLACLVKLIGLRVAKFIPNTSTCGGYTIVDRCVVTHQILSGGNQQGLFLYNSIVNNIVLGPSSVAIHAENNIITGQIEVPSFNNQLQISNNVFIGTGPFLKCNNFIYGDAEVFNNIFYGKTPFVTGGTFSGGNTGGSFGVFTYNVSYTSTFQDDDGNNIVADPLFVNVPAGTSAFNTAHNYLLQPNSPALLNPGDDGLQRGLYGGNASYSFSMTGEPAIPQIRTMSVPSSVFTGQSIQTNFSSKTNQ